MDLGKHIVLLVLETRELRYREKTERLTPSFLQRIVY